MDNSKFLPLLNINWELIEVCKWLKENQNPTLESKIVPITDELTRVMLELSVEPRSSGSS